MRENALDAVAGDLAQATSTLSAHQTLEQALALLVRHDHPGLPVLAADGQHVIGWLTHRDVLHAYNARLERSVEQAEQTAAQPTPGSVPAPGPGHEHPQSAHRAARAGRVDRRTPGAWLTPGISQAQRKSAQAAARDRRPEQDVHPLLDRLHGYRIVDLELTHDQPPARQRVMDVQWPPSSLVIAVRRNHQTFAPNGQTELRKGDRLSVLVPAEHAEALADVVHATQHCSPRA
jgi:hypothetical protein